MCLAILFHRHFADTPLALAANREEAYARPALAPYWWADQPIFAGQDQRAGGTWLGLNRSGLLVALTNRIVDSPADGESETRPRSRGQLCVDALRQSSASEALSWADSHLGAERYSPFNLLLADGQSAWVVHLEGDVRITELTPGIHYVAETDVNDPHHPRLAAARDLVETGIGPTWSASLPALRQTMGRHQPDVDPRAHMCRHLGRAGTVSSALVSIPGHSLEGATYEHAPGPPCTEPFGALTGALRHDPV